MTLLTSILGSGGSGGGGGDSSIGDLKQVMTGNVRQVMQSNTITDASGGIWIRAGQTYQQSSYPQLFAKIGYVNATIGLTKTNPVSFGAYQGATAYSPQDDLYVFPSGTGVTLSNSALQIFTYKSYGAAITSMAYGGDGGNQRFLIIQSSGTAQFYPSNQTFSGTNTSNPGQTGVVAANANTFITWNGSSGLIRVSTNSGQTWSGLVNTNTFAVSDIVWGNVGGPNGSYILTSSYYPGWTERSTDGINWTGLPPQDSSQRYISKFGLGAGNVYVALAAGVSLASNGYQSRVFTSTDALKWEYRGLLPQAPTGNNVFGVGSPKLTAVANGSNTVIASTDWFDNYYTNHTANHSEVYGGHWTFACHEWWVGYGHPDPHQFHCGDMPVYVHQVTSYHFTETATRYQYNRIYTANATATSNVSYNLYATVSNAPIAHNNQSINAIAFGYANNASYYLYGTSNGNVASSTDGVTWVERGPTLTSNNPINSIVYGTANSTNTFMLLGTAGRIITTQNLVTYTTRTTAYELGTQGWTSSAFGNANGTLLYVIGGNTGNLLISNDGIKFSGTNTLANINGVAFGNNMFVAALPNGVAKYSQDGIYWSNTGSIVGAANDLYAIASDGIKFVYTGQGGRAGYLYDVTGSWTNCTISTSNDHYGLTYGGGLWVMGGKSGSLFTSTDGISWTFRTSNTGNTILTTFYANNTYFYGGDNVLATSTDAITWIVRNPNTNYARISGFGYGNGVYVYGGQGFYGKSTDGVSWSTVQIGSRDNSNTSAANTSYFGQINDIKYGNSEFVSVGVNGMVGRSTDGNTWLIQNAKTDCDFTSITYGNNRYLAVGSNGVAKISPNGILWSGHASNSNVFSLAYYQNNVNTFILVGAARYANTMNANTAYTDYANTNTNVSFILETSNDGIYWSTRQWKTPLPPGYAVGGNTQAAIMDIGYGSGYTPILNQLAITSFAAAHNSSYRISTSPDAVNWSGLGMSSATGNTGRTAPMAAHVVPAISFANGSFFATSNTGIFARSNDGINWTTTNVINQFANTQLYSMPQLTSVNIQYIGYVAFPYSLSLGIYYPQGYWLNAYTSAYVYATFYKLKYHAATNMYLLPHNSGGMFTSKDLVTWTVRPSFIGSNPYDTTGPIIATVTGNYTLGYANNANNYVSAAYDVSTEFYVPMVFPYTLNYAANVTTGNTITTNTQVAPQSTGDNVDLVWYIKAKT